MGNEKSLLIVEDLSYLEVVISMLSEKNKKLASRVEMLYMLKERPKITNNRLTEKLGVDRRTLSRWWKDYVEGGLKKLTGLDFDPLFTVSPDAFGFIERWVKRGGFLKDDINFLRSLVNIGVEEDYDYETLELAVEMIIKGVMKELNMTKEEFMKKLEEDEKERERAWKEFRRESILDGAKRLLEKLERAWPDLNQPSNRHID